MQINIHAKDITLQASHEDYIKEKLGKLTHYAEVLQDESVKCDVHVEKSKNKTQGLHVEMKATILVPGDSLHAEVDAMQVTEAADLISEKLERQVKKYKESR